MREARIFLDTPRGMERALECRRQHPGHHLARAVRAGTSPTGHRLIKCSIQPTLTPGGVPKWPLIVVVGRMQGRPVEVPPG